MKNLYGFYFTDLKILIIIYEPQNRLSSTFLLARNFLDCYAMMKADLLALDK